VTRKSRFYGRGSALAIFIPILTLGAATSAVAGDQVAANDAAAPGEGGKQSGASSAEGNFSAATGGDIIVTARRRGESLSRVPISIASIGGADLASRGITSQADLQRSVPGLTIRSGQSDNVLTFTIRGQGVDTFSGSQSAVLTYFNDVPLAGLSASNFYDLESIQVLKGPQGTLFGRNTTGGAVLYTSAKPKDEFEGYVSAGIGNYDDRRLEAVLNLPLASDVAILRIAGNAQWRDGWQKNVTTGQELGRVDRQSVRATLALRPSEGFESTIVGGYSWLSGSNVGLTTYAVYPCGSTNNGIPLGSVAACRFGPANPDYGRYLAANPEATANGLVDQVAIQKALGTRKVNGTARTARSGRDWFIMNTSTLDLSPDVAVKNIISYSRSKVYNLWDVFGTGPYIVGRLFSTPDGEPGSFTGFHQSTKSFSEELQFSGTALGGDLKYIVGGFYAEQDDYSRAPSLNFDLRPIANPTFTQREYLNSSRTKALFAQATYDLSRIGLNRLKLTGGYRYTWERAGLDTLPNATQTGQKRERRSFKAPSWTVGFDWQAMDQLLLYVAQRGSFRSGGYNGSGPLKDAVGADGGNLFLPEKVRDIEAGAKFSGQVGMMPWRANLAAYTSKITNVQRTQFAITGGALAALTVNIPSARVKGVEFDTVLDPVDGLQIGGNVTYTNARYTNGTSTVFGQTYNYGPYADTPPWAGSAFFKVTTEVGTDSGELSLRGEVYAQSAQYFSNLANTIAPGTKLPSYALVNATLEWRDVMGAPIDLTIFIKNACQKGYFSGGFAFAPLGTAAAIPGEPRMFGVTAKHRF
jgi:iron complex outermembrane receptor protein